MFKIYLKKLKTTRQVHLTNHEKNTVKLANTPVLSNSTKSNSNRKLVFANQASKEKFIILLEICEHHIS